ncbi:transcription repressor NadR [Tissierella sp. Yu-01]|uniref:transcription repressor NadR n=1 Tax=Tissierella sp. Yu-01 TaxID=3035694 RepID=UPI00240CF116|nr:transcription repressor NadR [Tissierella sp. Yu-01]WFA08368.1 transcription repressor NadR [Tissierella sp. Yu-01]
METSERREAILDILNNTEVPVKGTALAEEFGVTRQVIVQDIAILRARGINILATAQGYMIPIKIDKRALEKKVLCNHKGITQMEEELNIIVDLGGKILDVIVDHPLYGEIKSPINVESRHEVSEFINNIKDTNAEPLSSLTQGLHLHTIEVKDEETYKRIKKALEDKRYLVKEE